MKKNLLISLIVAIAINANAYDFMVDGIAYNYNEDGTTVTVTYDKSFDRYQNISEIIIPSSVTHNGTSYTVTAIGLNAFLECASLTNVEMPNTITVIGANVFYECTNLTSVTIPNSVTTIGIGAFSRCSSLTSLTIPNSVTSIGSCSFEKCTSLTNVILPNLLTNIGGGMFLDCTNLSCVTIPGSVTSIGIKAFAGCRGLKCIKSYIEHPENVNYEKDYFGNVNVFDGVANTCSIIVPAGTVQRYNETSPWSRFSNIGCMLTSLSLEDLNVIVGEQKTIFTHVEPEDAIISTLMWSSSNRQIATVDSQGNVTGKNIGSATITSNDALGSGIIATCLVTVQVGNTTSISLNKTETTICIGESETLIATVAPIDVANQTISWTSSDNNVATVSSDGVVTANALGSAVITATTTDGTNLSATCEVTVTRPLATGISLDKNSFTTYFGKKGWTFMFMLEATIYPNNACDNINWTSSNESVAIVRSYGSNGIKAFVTSTGSGTATIVATTTDGSNLSDSCIVTVEQLATDIFIDPPTKSVNVGESFVLSPTVLPENTNNKSVTWSSNFTVEDFEGMTVTTSPPTDDVQGVLSKWKFGNCYVTNPGESYCSGSHSAVFKRPSSLTMTDDVSCVSNKITFDAYNASTSIAAKFILYYSTDQGNTWTAIANSSGETMTTVAADSYETLAYNFYTSVPTRYRISLTAGAANYKAYIDNFKIFYVDEFTPPASVDAQGTVTALQQGTAIITATTNDGSDLSAWCVVTVVQPVTGISLNEKSHTLKYNGQETFSFKLDATTIPGNASNTTVQWSSSDENVATVASDGTVTSTGKGVATITATTTDGSNLSDSCVVTVKHLATEISLDSQAKALNVGETFVLSPIVLPEIANDKSVTWSSNAPTVARVDSLGNVTALKRGIATITATTKDGSNLSASCVVTVIQPVVGITLNENSHTLKYNGQDTYSFQLTATTSPSNANNHAVQWSSSDENVAIVTDGGAVTSTGLGTAVITATTIDGSNLSDSCIVTVEPVQTTSFSIDKIKEVLTIGNTLQVTGTVDDAATIKNFNWTSSNAAVASVDASGLVRGVGAGTATVTATTIDGSDLSASCIVQVLYPSEAAGAGDVNEDGRIDITDATLIISYLQGNYPMSVLDEALMDVNGDGDINMSDVLRVISLIRNDN